MENENDMNDEFVTNLLDAAKRLQDNGWNNDVILDLMNNISFEDYEQILVGAVFPEEKN